MKSHNWYQITFRIDESLQDNLIGRLTTLNFSGFNQEKDFLKCYIPSELWTQKNAAVFKDLLRNYETVNLYRNLKYSIALIKDKNWNKVWEKQTGIVEASSGIIIKPSWTRLPKRYRDKIIIRIDPKMSFGTGHHETTRLSLNLIERFLKPNTRVLDIGCGTGILGIACVKLGARKVTAIDNDDWAVQNAKENVNKNRVESKMKVLPGSIGSAKNKFDLIVANLDYNTITKLINRISAKIQKNGNLIISGILTTDIPSLLPLFKMNFLIPVEIDSENEWAAMALFKLKL